MSVNIPYSHFFGKFNYQNLHYINTIYFLPAPKPPIKVRFDWQYVWFNGNMDIRHIIKYTTVKIINSQLHVQNQSN